MNSIKLLEGNINGAYCKVRFTSKFGKAIVNGKFYNYKKSNSHIIFYKENINVDTLNETNIYPKSFGIHLDNTLDFRDIVNKDILRQVKFQDIIEYYNANGSSASGSGGDVGDSKGADVGSVSGGAESRGLTILEEFTTGQGAKLVIALGSVVDFEGDAIVNAANERCLGGGGVDGAIVAAGGSSLDAARNLLPKITEKTETRCPIGDAKITSAPEGTTFGSLKARHVIHAVGPNYNDDAYKLNLRKADKLLGNAYKKSLEEANKVRATTIAFSLLSSSIFAGKRGKKDVIKLGIESINNYAKPHTTIYMVAYPESSPPYNEKYEEIINLLKATEEAKITFTNPRIKKIIRKI